MGKVYTYIRVSSKSQRTDRQEYELNKLDEKIEKAFVEKVSGKKEALLDRIKLLELQNTVKPGDTVIFESLSRVSRNLQDTINICEDFRNKGVRVKILKEKIDSDNKEMYLLMISMFGAINEIERQSIVERSIQRIEQLKEIKEETGIIATKSGKWFGRGIVDKESILKKYPKFEEYLKLVNEGHITKLEMAKMLGIGRSSLYRYLDIYYDKKKGD